jgi:hypothetical protein
MVSGVLLHFCYDWSGGSRVVASVAPANESVWEHLKLVVVPVIVLGVVESRWVEDRRRLWCAKLVEIAAAAGFIVGFFYTYTGALGVDSARSAVPGVLDRRLRPDLTGRVDRRGWRGRMGG